MKISEYQKFVSSTEQFAQRSPEDRRLIALYGVVGEIGSVGSAIKKRLLGEDGTQQWNIPNDEIVEEVGDAIWYCVALTQVTNDGQPFNVLLNDLQELQREISGTDDRAETIRATLDAANKNAFLAAFAARPQTPDITFDEYQKIAFLTARTQGRELIRVCLAVLWQLGAELLRKTLPAIEISLNRNVSDRSINVVLGEIIWHLSAVASVFELSLDQVIERNIEKVTFRANRDNPTPLHDDDREEFERLPRRFEICFVTVREGESRMYLRGKQLGDDLNNNYRQDDGYRFHDVMHLANAAHLGWSPVLRALMGKKRKSRDDQVDAVEDGARAQIVEELVLKAIHSEGTRLANEASRCPADGPAPTFPTRGVITFRLLKNLRDYVIGHEVWKNQYWEWEDAIFYGSAIYYKLRIEQQGTVTVDMNARKIEYSPDVCLDIRGASVGLGAGRASINMPSAEADEVLTAWDRRWIRDNAGRARAVAAKRAVYTALKVPGNSWNQMDVKLHADDRICVRARGLVQERMWATGAISFQLAFADGPDAIDCTAIAIADVADVS